MLPSYLPGPVLKVNVGNIQTNVIIVPHIFEHRLGFKSLLVQDREYSLSVEQLQHYEVTVVGSAHIQNYAELLAQILPEYLFHHLSQNLAALLQRSLCLCREYRLPF